MSETDLRDVILALITLSAGAVKEDNAEVAQGLAAFSLLVTKAIYHKRHMAASEWAEIDSLLSSFRAEGAKYRARIAEQTDAAGIAPEDLDPLEVAYREDGEPGSDGCSLPSPNVPSFEGQRVCSCGYIVFDSRMCARCGRHD